MQQFRADLHIHSRFSRATSGRLNARHLAAWARVKGLDVLGTGDFTHPKWRAELAEQLVLDEPSGLYRLRDPRGLDAELPDYAGKPLAGRTLFMLQAEISSIYKRGGKVRKVHNLVYVPDMDAADRLSRRLAEVGNIESDGRPILGLDSRNLLEMVLETHPQAFLVPAHIWTPWFALFGSKSGFDSVAECFGDLSSEIFAMETGLSSDPEMNWLWSELDRFALISNSDAHSGENLGREANLFSGEIGYESILRSLKGQGIGGRFLGTLEFFPEEGKYHLDGHRKCGVVMEPRETRARGGLCPVCGKPVTVGVLHRVVELADRETPIQSPGQQGYLSLIPLPEILGELLGVGAKSRKVAEQHARCIARFGSELNILQDVPEAELSRFWEPLGEGIARMRRREVLRQSGYDGEYGVVRVFTDKERASIQRRSVVGGLPLLEGMGVSAAPRATGKGKKGKGADRPSLLEGLGGAGKAAQPAPASEPDFEFSPEPATPGAAAAPGVSGTPDLSDVSPRSDGDDGPTPPAFAAFSAPRPPEGAAMRFNPAQRRALTAGPQPVLVLAGPGTGKTRTLVGRVLHLVETGIDARRILAVTFTRRAAAEMDERLATALGEGAPLPRTDTLHALAFEYWHRATPTPPVLLSEEAARRVFAEANPDEPAQRLREAWEAIGVCREKMRSCLAEHAPLLARYTDQKAAWNLADYTDLLEFWLDQVQNSIYASPWRHVLVDEIQDLSPLQLTLVRALAPRGGAGFFGIGDPDQSIYGFRGAHGDVAAFLREAWPDLSVVALEENYRSSARILDFAGGLMQGRSACGPLRAARDLPGELHLFEAPTAEGEAAWIGEQIRGLIGATSHSLLDAGHGRSRRGTVLDEGGFSPGDIAVLVRVKSLIPQLQRTLTRFGVPCAVPEAEAFWADQRVALILGAAGRMLGIGSTSSPSGPALPAGLSHRRLVAEGVHPSLADRLGLDASPFAVHRDGEAPADSPDAVAADGPRGDGDEASGSTATTAADGGDTPLHPDAEIPTRGMPHEVDCPPKVLSRGPLGVAAYLRETPPFDDLFWQSSAFRALSRAYDTHGGWAGLMNWISLQSELELVRRGSEKVQIMSLHAAKGLEFRAVFLPALEDGIMPFAGAGTLTGKPDRDGASPDTRTDMDEERRLLYVGMTRAAEGLFLSCAARRLLYGRELRLKPSRFLDDVPLEGLRRSMLVQHQKRKERQLSLM
ncbi:UvrD-helicase domain-containing protein [Nitratidesulfovibrio sp.]|uniref:UvrD-helicase domain-containing protein n=1 Tax=Nitratidesulfovibrio sp. TaxID=2802297 RepID=UPI003340ADEB